MKLLEENYNDKTVIVTGHTGFKGSWLSLWLKILGAKVIGISKDVLNEKGLYNYLINGNVFKAEFFQDINNKEGIEKIFNQTNPDYIFHLAAQPIVSESYRNPALTFHTNAIGTMNILESVRDFKHKINIIIITSDKCYENIETYYGYKEIDKLGGKDPYSASKACAEIIINSYSRSIYKDSKKIRIATARAGNVIGGGDWSKNRLIPDAIKSWQNNDVLIIRNPHSTRPWQHVLEPLRGYLLLGSYINQFDLKNKELSDISFNFGPKTDDVIKVEEVIDMFSKYWEDAKYKVDSNSSNLEASLLNLSYDKASHILGWQPKLNAEKSLEFTAKWYKAQFHEIDMFSYSSKQIDEYLNL